MLYPTLTQVELLKFFPKASTLLEEGAGRTARIKNLVELTSEQVKDVVQKLINEKNSNDNIFIVTMNEYPRLEGHEEKNLTALLATYLRNNTSENNQDMERKISRLKMIAERYPEGITTTIVPISGHKQKLQGAVCIGHSIAFPIEHDLFNRIHRGEEIDVANIIPSENLQDKTLPFFIESIAADTYFGQHFISIASAKSAMNFKKFLGKKREVHSTGLCTIIPTEQTNSFKMRFGFTQAHHKKNFVMLARRWS